MNILYNYIKILKTLPRNGQPNADGTLTPAEIKAAEAADARNTNQQGLNDKFDSGGDILDRYNTLYEALTTETLKQNLVTEKRIALAQDFSQAIQTSVRNLTFLERRNLSLNKTLGVSTKVSAGFGQTLDEIAQELKIGGGQARAYVQQFKQIAPLQTKNLLANRGLAEQLFRVQRSLTEQLGIAPEAANAIQLYGASFGESTEDNVTNMMQVALALEKQTGLAGAAKTIFEDIGSLGADIQMQFSRVPGSLEKAVLQARMLGTDFNTIAKVGTKLLDIESSINSELEFQLLSGQRLVDAQGNSLTAALREATVRGDAAAATEAMQKIIEETGETLETNVFARQEMAQLTGISEGNLMKMVQQNRLMGQIQLPDGLVSIAESDPTSLGQLAGQNLGQMGSDQDIRSTEQLRAEQSEALLTEQILNNLVDADQITQITEARTNLLESIKESADAYIMSADGIAQQAGEVFLQAQNFVTLRKPINDLAAVIPGIGTAVNKLVSFIDKLTGVNAVTSIQASINGPGNLVVNGPVTVTSNVGAETSNSATKKNDSLVQLNDAILFDPNDRFNILASTSQGSLDKATTNVAGGGGPTAQEIASAVADAISGIQIVTRIDDINEAQARNNYSINAIT